MLKVLIAEDDLMIADLATEVLEERGYEVCGIGRTVAEAVELGRRYRPDLAVIDGLMAEGGRGSDVAEQLVGLGNVGILYVTGNISAVVLADAAGHACLAKPYEFADLLRSLEIVAEMVTVGTATPPFPRHSRFCRGPHPARAALVDDDAAKVRTLLRQLSALARFGSFALRQTDLLKILNEAARVCAQGLGAPFCKVCRYRPTQNDLLIEAGYGWQEGVVGHVVSHADASTPQGRAFVTGKPSVCNDLRETGNYDLPPFYAAHGIISMVDVVIKGDGKPYGVLEIDSDQPQEYGQHDIDFLTGFANVLAEAVATSARTEILKRTIERMQALVEEKDRLLDQKKILAAELQHRVRNNMQLVYGMLSKQMMETTDEAGQRGIKAIARRVSTLAQVYDHLLGNEMTRTTDFGSYTKSLCSSLAEIQAVPNDAVQLHCESDLVILDLDVVTAMGIVVAELVTNSYDHAFPAGQGTITVSVHYPSDRANMAVLTISDDGVGFDATSESKRHGLGLARRLIEQVRGTFKVESHRGTRWTITFPVP